MRLSALAWYACVQRAVQRIVRKALLSQRARRTFSTADNADSAKSEDSKGDESDADSKVLNEQGELIKKTAAIFDGD